MNWDSVGAIAGIAALVLAIFIEWPKIVLRYKSIPPKNLSIIIGLIAFLLTLFSLMCLYIPIFPNFKSNAAVFISILIASNIIIGAIVDNAESKILKENNKSLAFAFWVLMTLFQLILVIILTSSHIVK